jgi:hypothetical protein
MTLPKRKTVDSSAGAASLLMGSWREPLRLTLNVSTRKKASLPVGVSHVVFQKWRNLDQKPSLSCMSDFCYALGISPLQLLTNDLVALKGALKDGKIHSQPLPKRKHYVRVERERAFELIQAVLNGREAILSVRGIERRLGYNQGALVYHFPQECALVTAQYRAHCTQMSNLRVKEMCDEVRQATLALNMHGIYPSLHRVATLLSRPSMMRTEEAKAI